MPKVNASDTSPVKQTTPSSCHPTMEKKSLIIMGLFLCAGAFFAYDFHAVTGYALATAGGVIILGVAITSVIQWRRDRLWSAEKEAQAKKEKDI